MCIRDSSSAGANKTAKRAAVIHLLFNVIGAVLFGIIMFTLFSLRPSFAAGTINSVQISIFHTVFNVTNTVLLFPFANYLVKLSGLIIKEKTDALAVTEGEDEAVLRHLDPRIFETPSFAVENVLAEVIHMGDVVYENVNLAFDSALNNDTEKAQQVFKTEASINNMEKIITEYLVKISNLSLTEDQHQVVNDLFYTISDMERVGDHAENIAELAGFKKDNDILFSDTAQTEMKDLMKIVLDSLASALKARSEESMEYVRKVVQYEEDVDDLEDVYKRQVVDALEKRLK